MRLAGKTAIVTGAGRGIGQGIALRLAEEGARVAVNDLTEEQARETIALIEKAGGAAIAAPADLTRSDAVDAMAERVLAEFGGVDILVNNAGVVRDNLIPNISDADWDFVIDTNLKSCFLTIRALWRHFKEREAGKIVSIASRALLGQRGQANYSASKGGLVSLTRAAAIEMARYNVNVNCIAPGLIDTPLIRSLEPRVQKVLLDAQPTPRIGTPRDIANATLFLVSEEASYITGQVLFVDGGKSLGANRVF